MALTPQEGPRGGGLGPRGAPVDALWESCVSSSFLFSLNVFVTPVLLVLL